ncbi:carboxypeptidase regulatory-like domain-containing protein [Pyxidicoccus parkwayensis]|uniref:Carboxypeptidase regulatory-like domain-containing protein n=1 Tax=Pyxidicoccus parkwayensis TaxID=2813578 RepID=A0ABX7P1J4_9BACT|nr:carboxypeptidase-like regulatory domain-containing protein [Pyxidicoccus parkwaysis]QSQ22418.1 carboxypeptidase regulatory-like domain-containing protein [Pyxidicoccus parkwaysis]
MPSSRAVLLLLTLALSWVACSHAPAVLAQQEMGHVPESCATGEARAQVLLRVVDEEGQPVPGARVDRYSGIPDGPPELVRGEDRVTNSAGEARLSIPVEPGRVSSLRITAEGYLDASWDLDLVAGEQQPLDVRLRRNVTLSGRVVDPQGKPLPAVYVYAVEPSGLSYSRLVETDAGGRFSLTAPPRRSISLQARSAGGASRPVQVVGPRQDIELVLAVEPPAVLSVVVRHAWGHPLAQVQVLWKEAPRDGSSSQWGYSMTDGQGRVEFILRTPGRFQVWALWKREDFQWVASEEVSLAPGQHTSRVLTFEDSRVRPPLTGRVTDTRGHPVQGVIVSAAPLSRTGPADTTDEQSWARSEADGRFTLKGLREGPVRLLAMGDTRRFEGLPPLDVPLGQDDVSFSLVRRSTLQARVVDPEGRPVPELSVLVNDEYVYPPEGRFEDVVVPEGRSKVSVVADGFTIEHRMVDVPAHKHFRLTEPIVLKAARTVRGRVVKEDGCTPIPGAIVALEREEMPANELGDLMTTRTDSQGRFSLAHLEHGPLVLRVGRWPVFYRGLRGPVPEVRKHVGAREDQVTIRFGPEASLTGVVTGSEGRPLGAGTLTTYCSGGWGRLDAAGRYVLHGLEGGKECWLQVSVDEEDRTAPPPVFSPRRVVLPERGTVRVDLSARRGPASLVVDLPRKDVWLGLLEGDVPMPETWARFVELRGALRPDPCRACEAEDGRPGALTFSQLALGRYTLLVGESRPELVGMDMVRVPVTLTAPGTTRVQVSASEPRRVLEAEHRPR